MWPFLLHSSLDASAEHRRYSDMSKIFLFLKYFFWVSAAAVYLAVKDHSGYRWGMTLLDYSIFTGAYVAPFISLGAISGYVQRYFEQRKRNKVAQECINDD